MSTSLTKKGLIAASDKVIVAARPALEIISQFTADFSPEAVKPGTGVAVDVLTATAETFVKSTNNYAHATGTIKNFLVATPERSGWTLVRKLPEPQAGSRNCLLPGWGFRTSTM